MSLHTTTHTNHTLTLALTHTKDNTEKPAVHVQFSTIESGNVTSLTPPSPLAPGPPTVLLMQPGALIKLQQLSSPLIPNPKKREYYPIFFLSSPRFIYHGLQHQSLPCEQLYDCWRASLSHQQSEAVLCVCLFSSV